MAGWPELSSSSRDTVRWLIKGLKKVYKWSKHINKLCTQSGHLPKVITQAMRCIMNLNFVSFFKSCEDCASEKAQWANVSKVPVEGPKIEGKRFLTLFITILRGCR